MDTTTTSTTSTRLVPAADEVFPDRERLAVVGFLAGYRGQARDAYTLDLRPSSRPGS
jgi:hypothetical protein